MLFYNAQRNDQGEVKNSIYRRRMSSDSAEVFLTGSENYSVWSLSPDGTWVIATANRTVPGKGRLLRIPLSGGTAGQDKLIGNNRSYPAGGKQLRPYLHACLITAPALAPAHLFQDAIRFRQHSGRDIFAGNHRLQDRGGLPDQLIIVPQSCRSSAGTARGRVGQWRVARRLRCLCGQNLRRNIGLPKCKRTECHTDSFL